jgi:hypothetical protein
MYVCFVLNNAFSEVIKSTPLRQAYGTDNDISPMLYFSFYEPVYYLVDETTFPSESKELCRRWVGVSENVLFMQESMIFLTSRDGNISGTLLSARNISYVLLNKPR